MKVQKLPKVASTGLLQEAHQQECKGQCKGDIHFVVAYQDGMNNDAGDRVQLGRGCQLGPGMSCCLAPLTNR